ncbi:MAG: hypothetical protein ACOC1F_05380 [Myxococcota bacterium]
MNGAKIIVVLLCGVLGGAGLSCAKPTPAAPAAVQGTTQVYADNRVAGLVELQQVSVAIDGEPVGGLEADVLGEGRAEPLRVASAQLAEGEHTMTIFARAAHKATADVLVLNQSQVFTVGREPVSVIARFSVPPTGGDRAQLKVDLQIDGGTLPGAAGTRVTSSCEALPPHRTAICITETMLREAIAERDALRVVCIDDALTRMREIERLGRPEGQADVNRHDTDMHHAVSDRIVRLGEKAKRCASGTMTTSLAEDE